LVASWSLHYQWGSPKEPRSLLSFTLATATIPRLSVARAQRAVPFDEVHETRDVG
jgi:hypothetical protein